MSRTETDSIGPIEVPEESYWGAQTQRSRINFAIGEERMPLAVVHALALIKKAAARINDRIGDLPVEVVQFRQREATTRAKQVLGLGEGIVRRPGVAP